MTDSDTQAPAAVLPPLKWKTWPGFSAYEASTRGEVHSLDRVDRGGRPRKGIVLKTRVSNRGYELVDVTDDDGKSWTKTVHSIVLAAHAGPCPPGKESLHLDDDPLHNTWAPGSPEEARAAGGNLVYGTRPENEHGKFSEGRARGPLPKPVPPRTAKRCIRCTREFEGNGRRCHDCVVQIGEAAAFLLSHGVRLEDAAKQLRYPSVEGVHALAVKYGGYGQQRRGVLVTLRDKLRVATRRERPRGGDTA